MSFAVKGNAYGLLETQTLSPDGVADTFNLNYRPGMAGAMLVVYDGVIQQPGTSYNLIDGGRKLVFTFVPDSAASLYILYLGRELAIPAVVGNYPVHDTGIGDGVNATFTLPVTPVEPALMVYKNGVLQRNPSEWTLSGNQVVFSVAPALGELLDFYIHGVERTDLVTVDDASITAAKLNLNYVYYVPGLYTFNGMSHLPPDFSVSKYMPLGETVKLRIMGTVTFGDTPDNAFRLSLPPGFNNDGTGLIAGVVKLRTATTLENGMTEWAGLDVIDIKREGGIDFTVGEEWAFEIALEYDAA